MKRFVPRRGGTRFTLLLAALAAFAVLANAAQARSAHAGRVATSCTKNWTNGAFSGLWTQDANWSPPGQPTAADDVCIDLGGTIGIGESTPVAHSVTLGANNPTLELVGNCTANAKLTVGGNVTIGAGDTLLLTAVNCGNAATLDASSNTITNNGTITVSSTGGRQIVGNVVSSGTITVGDPLTITGGVTNTGSIAANSSITVDRGSVVWSNQAPLTIADGSVVSLVGGGDVFTNTTGGSIAETGSGKVVVNGGTFRHGAGTITGPNAVDLTNSDLAITSGNAGSFLFQGAGNLSGNLAASQSLTIQSNCSYNAAAHAVANFTNAGSVVLNSTGCGNSATLDAGSNTITNSGTIQTQVGAAGARAVVGNVVSSGGITADQPLELTGALTNTGTVAANASITFDRSAAVWSNKGPLTIASGSVVALTGAGDVLTNAGGGSIAETGTGKLTIGGGTYNHAGGTVTGSNPIELTNTNLNITSANGAGFLFMGAGNLSGNLSASQPLTILANCSYNAVAHAAASFSTAATITLDSTGCGNSAMLDAGSNSITNTGTITATPGSGGNRYVIGNLTTSHVVTADQPLNITGALTNTGTIAANKSITFDRSVSVWMNKGPLTIADGSVVSLVGAGDIFTNGGGGSVAETGTGKLTILGGVYNHAGGTVTGSNPIELTLSDLNVTSPNAAKFLYMGSGNLSGNLSASQTLTLMANCSYNSVAHASASFSTAASITLDSTGCGNSATLDAGSNGITNTGTITTNVGASGARAVIGNLTNSHFVTANQPLELTGALTNTGTVTAIASITFDRSSVVWSNKGPVAIANGAVVALTGAGDVFTNAAGGSVAETGTGKLTIGGGTYNHAGGTVTGSNPIELTNSNLNVSASSAVGFLYMGGGNLSGNLGASQTLTLMANCSYNAVAHAAADFTNAGTIALTSTGCGNSATIDAGSNTLTNSGNLRVQLGVGGGRGLTGTLVNNKTLEIEAGSTLTLSGSYRQGSGGTYNPHVDSDTAFGALSVSGSSTLAGTLKITRLGSYTPADGKTFGILGSGSVLGKWTKMSGSVITGSHYFRPNYTGTGAQLVVTLATLGTDVSSGAPGSSVQLTGASFPANSTVTLKFTDMNGATTTLPSATTNALGGFVKTVTVPGGAASGVGTFKATSSLTGVVATHTFTVT